MALLIAQTTFRLSVERTPEHVTVAAAGWLDDEALETFEHEVRAESTTAPALVLDMRHVSGMDGRKLRRLLDASERPRLEGWVVLLFPDRASAPRS